jgi:hypothetical protein
MNFANHPHYAVSPASLSELVRVSQEAVEVAYTTATDPDFDCPELAVIATTGMSVPLVVPLPPFSDDLDKYLAHCRLLPTLCWELDATALVVASPAWVVKNMTGHPREPRPSQHSRREDVVMLDGVSREGESAAFMAPVSRGARRAPILGAWLDCSDGNTVFGALSTAHAAAVNCFLPEHVAASQASLLPWFNAFVFPDQAARNAAAGSLVAGQLDIVGPVGDNGLFHIATDEESAERTCAMMSAGHRISLTDEELSAVLCFEALYAPFCRAGYAPEELDDFTDIERRLIETAVAARDEYIANPLDNEFVMVSPPSVPACQKQRHSQRQPRNALCRCGSGRKSKHCCG